MAYIGKSPDGTGVRSRFYYTQSSGGGTSVSGSSDDGTSLAFSDGAYVDVFLNGVLLVAGTDYNTSTANTIAGLAALANGDVVEVVVYDIFTVADTVSALNGGTFSSAVTFNANANFGDNNKALFGAGSDLQIYHDGTDSHVADNGTGRLLVRSNGASINFLKDTSETMAVMSTDAGIQLYHDNTLRFQTHSNGATVGNDSSSGDNDGLLIINNGGSGDAMLRFDYESNGDRARIGVTSSGQILKFFTAGDNERMRIDNSGNIMMGTTSVGGTSVLSLGSSNYMVATHNDGGTSGFFGQIRFRNNANSADVGTINRVNDASVQYNTTSDARLKENIADMSGAIARVKQLSPKRYSWVNEELDAADQDGFLAHEAQTVVPVAVSGTQDEVDENGNPVYMQMDYSKLVPLLTGALQEAIAKIETLETKVAALEAGE